MASTKFDILFAGELMRNADPEKVRSQLQQRFKLSEAATDRLFSGRTVTVKRGVDTATASRYREVFRDAKALIEIRPVDSPSATPSVIAADPDSVSALDTLLVPTEPRPQEQIKPDPGALSSVTELPGYKPPEQAQTVAPEAIDVGHLSLVPGNDWTFEDCQPPLPPVRLPDISHLEIVAPEPENDTEQED